MFTPISSSKIYDKRDEFDFDIVNFPFLDGEVPGRLSYGGIHFTANQICKSVQSCERRQCSK